MTQTIHPKMQRRGLSPLRLFLVMLLSLIVVRAISSHYDEALLIRSPLPGNTFALVQEKWIVEAPSRSPRYFFEYVVNPIHNTKFGTVEVSKSDYDGLEPGQQVCVRQGQLAERVRDCYRP